MDLAPFPLIVPDQTTFLDGGFESGVLTGRTIDRLGQIALDNGQAATEFAIGLVNTVTIITRDALMRPGVPIDVAYELVLTEVHAHRRVAADTEVAIGPIG